MRGEPHGYLSGQPPPSEYYSKKEDLLILGIAADYYEALEVARDIVDEMYHTTGRFSIREFLSNNGQR